MNISNRAGIALVIVILFLVVLFIMLTGILALSSARHKKALYAVQELQALSLAEAGINRMLYEANRSYPPANIPAATEPFGPGYGSYEVTFTNNIPPELDFIVATGTVGVKTKTVKVKVRPDIAEAFNKHAVYARDIDINSTVIGNICYQSGGVDSITNAGTQYTETIVASANFAIPEADLLGYANEPAVYTSTYTDNNDLLLDPGEGQDSTDSGPAASYDPLTDTYTFNNATISSSTRINGNVILKGTTRIQAFLRIEKDVQIESTVNIYETIYADGNVDIIGASVNGGNIVSGQNITLQGVSINDGTIAAANKITLETARCLLTPPQDQAALVSDNTDVAIQTAAHEIYGIVYAKGIIDVQSSAGGTIIKGALIAGNKAILSTGSLTYDPTSFMNNTPVFKHFQGGIRIYLPVFGSWEEL
jgi:hypothetical protein